MTSVVLDRGTIALHPVGADPVLYYKITGPVKRGIVSKYAPKVVLGDYSKDSRDRLSVVTWNDVSGGIGKKHTRTPEDVNKMQLGGPVWAPGNMVLNPGQQSIDATPASQITAIGDLNVSGTRTLLAAWNAGLNIYKYDSGGDSWGSSLKTLPDAATDAINVVMPNGTEYLVFATYDSGGSGYTYTSDGASFTDDTTDTQFLAFWDDRLWGISHSGQLWFATTIGTETTVAKLNLPDGYVTNLFVGPDATGEPIIYAATKVGLYAYDSPNDRFVKTGLVFPEHPDGGKGAITWNGAIYITAGLSMFQYSPRTGQVFPVGLDRLESLVGISAINIKSIVRLQSTSYFIFASLTSGTGIYAFDGSAWFQWSGDGDLIFVSNAYGSYRIWQDDSSNDALYFNQLPTSRVDSRQNTSFVYGSTGFFLMPWFDAGENDANKLAVRLHVEVEGASADEKVTVFYRLNYSNQTNAFIGFTTLKEITSDGVTTISFPDDGTSKEGLTFRAIQFRLSLARGSTTTATPNVKALTMEYRKKLTPKEGFQVELDLRDIFNGRDAKTQGDEIVTAAALNPLLEFTYRPDDASNEQYTSYVDIENYSWEESTGTDWGRKVSLTLVEP